MTKAIAIDQRQFLLKLSLPKAFPDKSCFLHQSRRGCEMNASNLILSCNENKCTVFKQKGFWSQDSWSPVSVDHFAGAAVVLPSQETVLLGSGRNSPGHSKADGSASVNSCVLRVALML